MLDALQRLAQKGVRFGTVIDIGCADGHLYLALRSRGLAPAATSFNVDANPLYESSLAEIASVTEGRYWIGAVTDLDGEIELTTSIHPYWASLRPKNDPYWERVNGLSGEGVKTPAAKLDTLVQRFALKPPFLLKLDVQGAEESVLRGAAATLRDTHAVVVEADVDDFEKINGRLIEAGFSLYDLTHLNRQSDGTLGWFYPIYLKRELDHVRPRAFWSAAENARVVDLQVERRKEILRSNAELLDQMRKRRSPP
jgi:FkbM family methyltransferase